jgi:hypothetical protein
MSTPYDETFEEFERRTGLSSFFGEYSTEVRGKLLSKNLERPQNIYDVFYSQVRKDSLSKNVSISSDIDKTSEGIRNSLLSKQVSQQISLEESGENTRKRILSKNKLIESAESLEDLGEKNRRKSIAKNSSNKKSLSFISKNTRSSNINKNTKKNDEQESGLLIKSENYRLDSISKNNVKDNDPYNKNQDISESGSFRRENLSRNKNEFSNLETNSRPNRTNNLSKNLSKNNNLIEDSEIKRRNLESKNVKIENDLELSSEDKRNSSISKNSESKTDLEKDSSNLREENLKRNLDNKSDLEKDSNKFRDDDLSSNNSVVTDLEKSSLEFREDDLSKNIPTTTDLEGSSELFREDDLSNNSPVATDLENSSIQFRNDDLSNNSPVITDLEGSSEPFREDDLSNNSPVVTDLEGSSEPFREDDLSNNSPVVTDLEGDSKPFREDVLSFNSPVVTDLESNSTPFREDDLSNNSPVVTDLESSSEPFREDVLSFNSPVVTDLESSSEPFREDDLSNNSSVVTDLEGDSTQFRNDDLSANVPITSDLEMDSGDYWDDNISSNVGNTSDLEDDSSTFLDDNMSSNVPIDSDLEVDSSGFRAVDLSANVPINSDLDIDSIVNRGQNLANNVSILHDLTGFSKKERDQQLSNNDSKFRSLFLTGFVFRNLQLIRNSEGFSLGKLTNIEEVGDGALLSLTPRNKYTFENPYQGSDEGSIDKFNEISTTASLEGGFTQVGIDALEKNIIRDDLKKLYGTRLSNTESDSKIDTGLLNYTKPIIQGGVTSVIALHNIQQNTFQSRPGETFKLGSQGAVESLTNFTNEGFQELISKTGIHKNLQSFTNTTPENIIAENDGTYLSESSEKILKPNQTAELGTASSMVSQSETTDTIGKDFDGDNSRRRGVRYVIDKIRNSEEGISFAKNFNVQGEENTTSVFVLGKLKDGTERKSYNRYSIKNPYAPESAQALQFNFTNYAIKDGTRTMSFPAYITAFQHGDKATWNSINYLGRPEPIYTYGSSSRDGSVSFVVLTDYASEVDIGYSFDPNTGSVTKETVNFTGVDFSNRATDLLKSINDIKSEIKEVEKEIQSDDTSKEEKEKLQVQIGQLKKQEEELQYLSSNQLGASVNFDESTSFGRTGGPNVYKWMEGFQENEKEGEFVESKAENTLKKLEEMKNNLVFQPSYFSGSKVDFVERMEFLSKLTRPARNNSVSDGFSFTDPPVCHIHLGDWFNHDIIIESVSYDYSDAPWTLDGGKAYPMWCKVSVNFNIIGSYGARNTEDAPLATDKGGFFGRRRTSTF